MRANAPAGWSGTVTALGIGSILLGVLHLLAGIAAAAVIAYVTFMLSVFSGAFRAEKAPPPAQPPFHLMEDFFPYMIGVFLGGLLMALVLVIAGIGLLARRGWGRVLTLLLGGLTGFAAGGLLVVELCYVSGAVVIVVLLFYACYSTAVFATLPKRKFAAEFSGRPRPAPLKNGAPQEAP